MKWTDSLDIAIELCEAHPEVDPRTIRFTDLHAWVLALPGFDEKDRSTWGNPARNDPCPCGSGLRFKHCHGLDD